MDGIVDGQSARLECRLQPVNDPTLKVYWTKNGLPLPEGDMSFSESVKAYVNLAIIRT